MPAVGGPCCLDADHVGPQAGGCQRLVNKLRMRVHDLSGKGQGTVAMKNQNRHTHFDIDQVRIEHTAVDIDGCPDAVVLVSRRRAARAERHAEGSQSGHVDQRQ